jgi:hypothetical protein
MASDWQIFGPDGKPIPNRGADASGMYTRLASGVKTWATKNDPGLVNRLGWGGAFGTQLGGGGVPDLMHFDLGGSRGRMVPERQFSRLPLLPDAPRRIDQANNAAAGGVTATGNVNVAITSNGTAAKATASADGLWQKTTIQNYKQMQKTEAPNWGPS